MNKGLAVLSGIGIGAALMYLLDPNGGRRRRALIRDKAIGLTNDARQVIDKRSRDLSNRAQGLMHEAKSLVSRGERETENQAEQTA